MKKQTGFWLTDELQVKDYVTLINATFGMLSIYYSIEGNFLLSAAMIVFAVVADYSDGWIARKTNTKNEIGKQLDSLSDIVSFGVAPGVLSIVLGFSYLKILFVTLFILSGIVRLARFNIQKESGEYFGLPIPIAALVQTIVCITIPDLILESLIVLAVLMVAGFQIKKP